MSINALTSHPDESRAARSDEELQHRLRQWPTVPLEIESETSARALEMINTVVLGRDFQKLSTTLSSHTSLISGVALVLTPIFSYGLQVWSSSEPIICCVAGTPSEGSFFNMTKSKLRKATPEIMILHANADDTNMFELGISGIKIILQYHQSPIARQWGQVDLKTHREIYKNLPFLSRARYEDFVTQLAFVERSPNLVPFRPAYYALKMWARSRGIWSENFHYLGQRSLLNLIFPCMGEDFDSTIQRVFASIPTVQFSKNGTIAVSDNPMLGDAVHAKTQMRAHENGPTAFGPSMIVKSEFELTRNLLGRPEWTYAALLDEATNTVFSTYARFATISISYWGLSSTKEARFVTDIEQQIIRLVRSEAMLQFEPRVWPIRFTSRLLNKEPKSGTYEAFYLVCLGLSKPKGETGTDMLPSPEMMQKHFPFNYDTSNAFVEVQITSKIDLDSLRPDDRDWGLIPDEKQPSDSDDEDFSDDPSADSTTKKRGKGQSKSRASAPRPGIPTASLRPALDILHRIRHDTSMDVEDYIIGYDDRHSGIKEMPVAWWKTGDSTTEDFIPQSRIRYFRRKSDEILIWDRDSRLDLLFGSGVRRG